MSQRLIPHLASGLALACSVALLGACSTPGSGPEQSTGVAGSTETTSRNWSVDTGEPVSNYENTFTSASQSLDHFDWMDAETTLAQLGSEPLTAEDRARLGYLRARVAHVRGQEDTALRQLAELERSQMSGGLALRVYELHRQILSLAGRDIESAQLGVPTMQLAPDEEQAALKQDIWLELQRSDGAALAAALETASDPVWQGWLQLALVTRQPGADLADRLRDWQRSHPGHPAAHPLPGDLEALQQSSAAPGKVALILPLSGRLAPAGKAVREGYLASYYAARQRGDAPDDLVVLDSMRFGSATEAYRQAVAQGARMVVGPLRKEAVAELDALLDRPVPVLALNRIDSLPQAGASPMVQLALAPEDEVRRLAERAFGDGARRILVLRPAGSWGDKLEATLENRWRELGGSIADNVSYTGSDEYSDAVKSALGIAASEERRRRIRDMLATNVEFTPRRRQDIDAVFMLSPDPAGARAIKPLLAFHYAGGLPAYAPSGVYGGVDDPRDRDLNGVRLVEIPWLLGASPDLRAELASARDDQYPRLNALGADAYLLQSRFGQLHAGSAAILRGNTGLLQLNAQSQIERDLPLAEFEGGRIRPR